MPWFEPTPVLRDRPSNHPSSIDTWHMAGIIDDIFGVNFVQGSTSGDPYDDNGHGTFVAGVVGAVGNNGIGTSGVSQVASVIGKLTRPQR